MLIEDLIVRLSKDPFNPVYNFEVAEEYKSLNQTASAVSFYLRCAEYGDNSDYVYASLLRLAECFEEQNDRSHTVSNCLLQAIAHNPKRPEAYFLMACFHERASAWQECYTFATLGLGLNSELNKLPADVGYIGDDCLWFEIAVSAYWIGRLEESIELFKELRQQKLPDNYYQAIDSNLERIYAYV